MAADVDNKLDKICVSSSFENWHAAAYFRQSFRIYKTNYRWLCVAVESCQENFLVTTMYVAKSSVFVVWGKRTCLRKMSKFVEKCVRTTKFREKFCRLRYYILLPLNIVYIQRSLWAMWKHGKKISLIHNITKCNGRIGVCAALFCNVQLRGRVATRAKSMPFSNIFGFSTAFAACRQKLHGIVSYK